MPRLYIARRPTRQALFLGMEGSRSQPSVILPLSKDVSNSELDELTQRSLEKLGVPRDQWHAVVEKAERDYEYRRKVAEASEELHRRIREQAEYSKLKFGGLRPPRKRSQH